MSKSLTDVAVVETTRLLAPLAKLSTAAQVVRFIEELGWDLGDILATNYPVSLDISQFATALEDVVTDVVSLAEASDEEAAQIGISLASKVPGLVAQAIDIAKAIERIIKDLQSNPPAIQMVGIAIGDAAEFAGLMARRLLDLLLYQYLRRYHQRIFSMLHFLGLAEVAPDDAYMPIKTIRWECLPTLLTDPGELINRVYEWDSELLGDKFLDRTELMLRAFLIPGGIYTQSETIRTALGREIGDREIRLPLYQSGIWPHNYTEIDINLSPIPEKQQKQEKAGLFLYPYLSSGASLDIDISDNWEIQFKGLLSTNSGVGLEIRPPVKLNVVNNTFDGNPDSLTTFADAHIEVGISSKAKSDRLNLVFGSEDGSYLGFREVGSNLTLALDNGKEEFTLEMLINDLSLKIDITKGDGFIQKILSGLIVESVTDLTIGISNKEGFYFQGSSDLSIVIPVHEDLGPISIDSVTIGVGFGDKITIILAVSFGFELGPIVGSVDKIGIQIPFSITNANEGNLGPLDINGVNFLSPTGAGIAVDTGVIVGGGFLKIYDDNQGKRYSGTLALQLGDTGITAVGIIATRMPGGAEGYSMLVNIGITFDPAIQIYAGFTLAGVGGLIGVNRTMESEVLRWGLKKGTLDSILFPDPKKVVLNANQILSDMHSVFPPEEGRFVIGPMIKLGWGVPVTVVTGEIGIFIEVPDPVRVVLMGQVEMALPDSEVELVGIHIDILGVVDVEKKELSFQASCKGSGMGTFELYGDAAFFLRWGDNPEMALAIGGFHPKFTAPPPRSIFSDLDQIRMNLNYGPTVSLRLGGYLALTPNTLQLGSRIELFIGVVAVDAGISGFLSFDALFYFEPFAFEGGMAGGVSVSVKGFTLADIRVVCTLSGPAPWNVHGKGMVQVLCFDIDIGFEIEWGQPTPALPEAIDPWPKLERALARPQSWGSRLPAEASMVEALRGLEEEPVEDQPAPVVVHPTGTLEVRQNVAPLEVRLDKLGNAPVENYNEFSIVDIQMEVKGAEGKDTLDVDSIDEYFARGQFEYLTDPLSVPSFEKLPGGVTTRSSHRIVFGEADRSSQALGYESVVIKGDRTTQKAERPSAATTNWSVAQVLASGNAARRGALRGQGHARFASQGEGMVGAMEEKYRIVDAQTLAAVGADTHAKFPDAGVTRVQADQALAQYLQLHPEHAGKYLVVAEFEAESEEAA